MPKTGKKQHKVVNYKYKISYINWNLQLKSFFPEHNGKSRVLSVSCPKCPLFSNKGKAIEKSLFLLR